MRPHGFIAILALALAMGGCNSGVTQKQKEEMKTKAAQEAYDAAYKPAYDASIKQGMTPEAAAEVAALAGQKAAKAAEALIERTVPVAPEGGDGGIWGKLLYIVLNAGIGFIGRKT